MCPHVSLATFGTQILLIYSRILLLQHVHFFAKNQDLTNLQDRLGAALQNCGKAQGFCKIAARLRAPPNCQALYSCCRLRLITFGITMSEAHHHEARVRPNEARVITLVYP